MKRFGNENALRNVYRVLCGLLLAVLVMAFESSSLAGQITSAVRGVTDSEVKIGTAVPLTGAAANYGPIYQGTTRAYINYVNDQGGVNGRKINLIIKDSGYDPAKGLAVTRQMVEEDKIFAMVAVPATPVNNAIYRYLNSIKVYLGAMSGAVQFNQPKEYPYIFQSQLSYAFEPLFTWRVVSERFPGKKIGVLYQNDDFGKTLQRAFSEKAGNAIVAQQPYESADTDISSQMQALKLAGAEVVVEFVLAKYALLAARFVQASGWKAPQIISANAMDPVLFPGLSPDELSLMMGVLPYPLLSDTGNPQVQLFKQVMKKYAPDVALGASAMQSFAFTQLFIEMLKRAGRDVTPEKLITAAEAIEGFRDILLIGPVTLSNTDHCGVSCVRLTEMKGAEQVYASDVMCK